MHLNTHSRFSLRYGVLSVDDILSWAQANGVTRMALTDVGTTSANWDFVRRSARFGVTPVLGIDVRNGNARQFVALARHAEGYEALCRWFSELNLAGASFPARLPEAVRAAGVAAIYPWAAWREMHNAETHERPEATALGTDEWVGVQAWEVASVRLARADCDPELAARLVALSTATFTCKRDWNTHRLLRAIDHNTLLSRLDAAECGDPRDCFRTPEELREAYAGMPGLVVRAEDLLAGCAMTLPEPPKGRLHNNPHTYTGSEDEDEALVRALCAEGLAYRYPDHDDAVLERMEHEIGLIRKQGFLAYFLINWDITSYARSKGYFHVGRGSGANSLVAYLLRITDVDPIELDLYFERFLNLYRANPPDFDIDFSWTDRDDVVAYMFQRFPNVALLAAYNTFQYRAAVRELGKVMGLPKHEIDALCAGKFNPNRLGEMEMVVLKYAAVIRDFPSSLTLHACGVLIANDNIHRYGALFMPPKGLPTVMFDMVVAEDVGLHKFDILSQRGLGKIKDALEMVRARDPETAAEIDIHDMRRFKADEGVRAMLREARATGCFYVESPAMRMLMRKLQVDDYLGLVAASSVIRPGVSRSGMMQAYIERHRDPSKRGDAHPVLLHLMPETYGVMVYQEDVIKVAHRFAGLDLGEADVLRRGMSGKFRSREEFDRARDAFHTKAVAKGHAPDMVREVWRQMESFAGYAFAKGHSASYAVESYQSLFLKVHFPLEYMCACINNFGGFYRTEFYVHEARMLGARIEAPCVNTVGALAVADPTSQTLTLGFNLVKDLNHATITALEGALAEGGPFTSLVDLVERVAPSLEQLTILIRVGALRFTGASKHVLLWEAHFLLAAEAQGASRTNRTGSSPSHVAELLAGRRALPARTGAGTGELFPPPKPRTYVLPPLDAAPLTDAFDEWELLGFPLCSPFLLLTEDAKAIVRSGVLARDLPDRIGDVVTVVGHLVTVKETATAKGERMCFGCFIDLEGAWLDTVHFPGVARDFPFRGRGVYAVRGTVSESFGCLNIDAQRMERLATLPDPRYAENGVLPSGLDSGISGKRRQPPKSAKPAGFPGTIRPASLPCGMRWLLTFMVVLGVGLLQSPHACAQNDQCDGGALKTHEAYLYGRFETRMSSTQGSGIVSSFFLYNWDLECNYPAAVNEIDIEMTGNLDNSVQFTTHHPFLTSVTEIVPTPFNPHLTMVDYAIEWEPTVVRWFINGELSTEFTHGFIDELVHPMRIFMNLWAVENLNWTGEWDPSAMPGTSRYDYVKRYAYTPGTGNAGTGNNYTLEWTDHFDTLDDTRWDQSEDGSVGPLCTFRGANVNVANGELTLTITPPSNSQPTRPVTLGVDASSLSLMPSDVIYVAGGFNGWCANCDPLQDEDGDSVWTTTLALPLGEHQFQYVVNGWGGPISQPSLGSACDFNPCDEWTNYGVSVDEEAEEVFADLHCWNTCTLCGSLEPNEACLGDLDNDAFIGVNDVLLLLSDFGCTNNCNSDLDGDGVVAVNDVLLMLGTFGASCG